VPAAQEPVLGENFGHRNSPDISGFED
jgi:hypothetical protein